MHDRPQPKVLIRTPDPAAARSWRDAALSATGAIWLSAAELPAGEAADVVVTDYEPDERTREAGVVGMGPVLNADVALPADCTARELNLAITLVAEIARLRNERNEFARNHEEVRQLAQTDPLTGLPNRRAWDEHFAARLAHAHAPLWLAIVDLDNFKQVNDRRGMAEGDQVLARAARALADALRRDDIVARLGGDEFGVLLGDMPEDNLRRVFDRLRAALEAIGEVTASIGYVSTSAGPADPAQLFAAAERAMREAKRAGGNRALPAPTTS